MNHTFDIALAAHLAKDFSQAESLYLQLLQNDSQNGELQFLLGSLYFQTEQYAQSITYLSQALQNGVATFEVYSHLGLSYFKIKSTDAAIAAFKKTLAFDPNNVKTYLYLGELYRDKQDIVQALQYYQQAMECNPNEMMAHHGAGVCFAKMNQLHAALQSFKTALQLDPNNTEVRNDVALLLCQTGQLKAGLDFFQNTLPLLKTIDVTWDNWLFFLNHSDYFSLQQTNEQNIFYQKKVDEIFSKEKWRCKKNINTNNKKIRLGYFSPDFRTHSVAYFLMPIFQNHNRQQFEIFAYANVALPDKTTEKFKSKTDQWREVHTLSNEALAKIIYEDKLDILIDLAGHTEGGRSLALAQKPAPIQINYLGYPATSALSAMDYRITDLWADPENTEQYFSETLLRMPHGFLCYQPNHMVGAGFPRPQSMGGETPPLPSEKNGYITFGCFNDLTKLTPELICVWSKILNQLPEAKLILKNRAFSDQNVKNDFLTCFAKQGVAAERLQILGWISNVTNHLAIYDDIDIALDTFPYNGTTTTCEAFSMSVPIISWAGATHASRVGLSLMMQMGHPELVAFSEAEYIQKAVELALDSHRLKNYHQQLSKKLSNSSLCNAKQFTLDFENLLLKL